jgi:hypothetical protein
VISFSTIAAGDVGQHYVEVSNEFGNHPEQHGHGD